ncbi:MAG: hypothetical protein ABIO72_02375 [Patescibacteria group bacterium]
MKRRVLIRRVDDPPPIVVHRPREDFAQPDLVFVGDDGFQVFLPAVIAERLVSFSKKHAPLEWAGLIGAERREDENGNYLQLVAIIPYQDVIATRTTVEMTPTSERVARELLALIYPQAVSVGWCHTHPSLGIFLSSTDRATQSTWESKDSLAIVVDHTKYEAIGVFRGPDGKRLTLKKAGVSAREAVDVSVAVDFDLDDEPTLVNFTPPGFVTGAGTTTRLRKISSVIATLAVVGGLIVIGRTVLRLETTVRNLRDRINTLESTTTRNGTAP